MRVFRNAVGLDWGGGSVPGSARRGLGKALRNLRGVVQRIRGWRRIRFTRAGLVFTLGSFAVGLAAFNTGNNLLYLLFGSMLGLIVVSGWLSEQVIRDLSVTRRIPRGATAGNPLRLRYEVINRKKRMPSMALEVGEVGLPGTGYLPLIEPGSEVVTSSENHFARRGVFPLRAVTFSTSFPFGLFRKSRDIPLGGEVIVWPRSDRRVRPPEPQGSRNARTGVLALGSAGVRGEYRGLRSYRPGDDPRDIHWRTTARLGQPVVREYDEQDAATLWLCLDPWGEGGTRAEIAVEIAASLAAQAYREGRRFALVSPGRTVEPGLGPGHLERVLSALARVEFSPLAPQPLPPVSLRTCVLVSLRPGGIRGFGDLYAPPDPHLEEEGSP